MKKLLEYFIILISVFSITLDVFAKTKETKETKATETEEKITCDGKVNVYLFWRDGCPFCEAAKTYFSSIEEKYGNCYELKKYNIYEGQDNANLMEKVGAYFGDDVSGVPYIVIGEKTFKGYSAQLNTQIEKAIVDGANEKEVFDVMTVLDTKKGSGASDTIVTILILLVAVGGVVALIRTSRSN